MIPPLCLLLASKYDEIDENIPDIKSLLRTYNRVLRLQSSSTPTHSSTRRSNNWNATAMTITYDDMLRAEKETLVTTLEWDLMVVTPLQVL